MRYNFKINGLENISIAQGVVGADDGLTLVDFDRAKDAIRITDDESGKLTPQFKLESLARKYGVNRVHLLKMDIEGAEIGVLKTSKEFVCNSVDKMIIEIHGRVQGLAHPLVSVFQDFFKITVIHDNVLSFTSKKVAP